MTKINWESVYDGTIRPVPPSVDYWGVKTRHTKNFTINVFDYYESSDTLL